MPETYLHVELLAHTPDPEKTCALAARTCYSAMDYDELKDQVDEKDQAAFLRRIVASGHLSVLEHASFTFGVSGVSRALLAQITRHRIASFSVQSQRYVSLAEGFGYIIPPRIKALGEDAVEFMISANPGEPLKGLSKIASGGELSRIMLALKSLEAERGGVGCMVFDEIDTGISGRMAQVVAEKMSLIARSRQVICVTHLPQIAAMADHEFLVEKHEEGGRTNTSVHLLTDEERIHEVGRMISGTDGTDTSAQAHAAHMLSSAANFRAVRDGIAPQSTN